MPLVDYGITELQALNICREHDLLSPAYKGDTFRLGCWFCHNQRIGELKRLRKDHPKLWKELLELDKVSPVTFRRSATIHDLDCRFAQEDLQIHINELSAKLDTEGRT